MLVIGAIVGAGLVGLRRRLDQGLSGRATSASTSGPSSLGLLVVSSLFVALGALRFTHVAHRRSSFTRYDCPGIELGTVGWVAAGPCC